MKDYEKIGNCNDTYCEYFDERMELNCAYSEDNSECIKTIEPLSSHAVLYDGWRDVRNELPDVGREVLVYSAGAYCVMMRLKYTSPKGETRIKWSDGNRSYIGVDAWMPLPDPPAFA